MIHYKSGLVNGLGIGYNVTIFCEGKVRGMAPQYRPLQAVAYERLRDMIQDGELAFDAIYSETRLAAEFSISRTPMREALVRLQNDRYIDILPNRGFRLHRPTREDIVEAFHMRAAIESHCAALIAREHASACARETVSAMRAALGRQRSLAGGVDLKQFWKLDMEFHAALIAYPGISAFHRQFDSYMHFFAAHCIRAYLSKGRDLSTIEEHRALVDALEAGDEAAARAVVQRHMEETLNITLQNME